jgi:hypothetical protein
LLRHGFQRRSLSSGDGLSLGSPPVHSQFILGALFLRPEREKVHTVVGSCCNKNWEAAVQTKLKDNGRMGLWGFLAVIVISQLYVVRELLAAFALFALGFAAIALVVAGLYMLQHCGELIAARFAGVRQPVMNVAASRENQKAA